MFAAIEPAIIRLGTLVPINLRMVGGEPRSDGSQQRIGTMSKTSQVSGLISGRRELNSRSNMDSREHASSRGHDGVCLHTYAAAERQFPVPRPSGFTTAGTVQTRRLAGRPDRWERIRATVSSLFRSCLTRSKKIYHREAPKNSLKHPLKISAPIAIDLGGLSNRVHIPANREPELRREKLGRLDEALNSNPFIPDTSMERVARLRDVTGADTRRYGCVFLDNIPDGLEPPAPCHLAR